MRNRAVAIRPTWRAGGLGFAAAVLAGAGAGSGPEVLVWFGIGLAAALALVTGWVLWQVVLDRRVQVVRHLSPLQLQAGHRAITSLQLRAGQLPLLGTLTDSAPQEVRTATYKEGLGLRPRRRGALQLGPVRLRRADPFGLVRWSVRVRPADEFLVWPRTDAVRPEVFTALRALATTALGSPRPEVDDVALREYRTGDPLQRVHWKQSAKHGSLLVRQDEPRRATHFDLVLVAGSPRSTDAAVDVLASAALALSGPDGRLRVLAPQPTLHPHLAGLLDELAQADPIPGQLPTVPADGAVVVALGNADDGQVRALVHWLVASEVDPGAVFIFPTQRLPALVAEQLNAFTVVPT